MIKAARTEDIRKQLSKMKKSHLSKRPHCKRSATIFFLKPCEFASTVLHFKQAASPFSLALVPVE